VLTAEDLKPLKLHWMPTLAGDVQAVLADEKVLFQGQEVAFVVADDRYIAADAVDLIEVDYEELPMPTVDFDSVRRVGVRMFEEISVPPGADFYICGPAAFMNGLVAAGNQQCHLARPGAGRR
jgi:carbon-monoxide dehydrogenase large subunit